MVLRINHQPKRKHKTQMVTTSLPLIKTQNPSMKNINTVRNARYEHQHKNHNNQRANIPSLSIRFLAFFRGLELESQLQPDSVAS